MIRIDLPVSEETIRTLKVGDEVSLHGTLVTARDAAPQAHGRGAAEVREPPSSRTGPSTTAAR